GNYAAPINNGNGNLVNADYSDAMIVGRDSNAFSANFNGSGRTISNVSIDVIVNHNNDLSVGVFGDVKLNGKLISDLNIDKIKINVEGNMNQVNIGSLYGVGDASSGVLQNIQLNGVAINGKNIEGCIGGLLGSQKNLMSFENISISDISINHNNDNTSSESIKIGGFAGQIEPNNISNMIDYENIFIRNVDIVNVDIVTGNSIQAYLVGFAGQARNVSKIYLDDIKIRQEKTNNTSTKEAGIGGLLGTGDGTIQNITIKNVDLFVGSGKTENSTFGVGGLIGTTSILGFSYSTYIDNIIMENFTFDKGFSGLGNYAYPAVAGGIVGTSYASITIKNVTASNFDFTNASKWGNVVTASVIASTSPMWSSGIVHVFENIALNNFVNPIGIFAGYLSDNTTINNVVIHVVGKNNTNWWGSYFAQESVSATTININNSYILFDNKGLYDIFEDRAQYNVNNVHFYVKDGAKYKYQANYVSETNAIEQDKVNIHYWTADESKYDDFLKLVISQNNSGGAFESNKIVNIGDDSNPI
ncbi:hypothetical protein, partial [Helicobacter pullorum]|uniref:hypothetical protein n=1 Tax=Helicobacter pullorum TaxID=35818 RepID=UPI000B31FAA8